MVAPGPSGYEAATFVNTMAYHWKRQMTAAEVIRQLEANGWTEVSQRGSHRKFAKNGFTFPVPDHGSASLAAGTLASIRRFVERADSLNQNQ